MSKTPPELPGKQASHPSSSWGALFLNRANQTAFSILWVAAILGCVWYFVTARGFQPIDIDEAEAKSSLFLVEVNTASEHEFACLPGIGKKTAASITSFRTENGPFASIDSMVEVPGISSRLLENVRSFLYLESGNKETKQE